MSCLALASCIPAMLLYVFATYSWSSPINIDDDDHDDDDDDNNDDDNNNNNIYDGRRIRVRRVVIYHN